MQLGLAISPYHLTTRELPAAVALMLADRAVTIVPEPAEGHGRQAVRASLERVPRLLRVLEAWRWSGPLWRAGYLAGESDDERPFASIPKAAMELAAAPALSRLAAANAPVAEPGDSADRWLDSFCTDLLRGGPDPAMSTVATAALDRFAAARGFVAVRGSTDSLTQRAELRLMKKRFSVAIPVMSRAAGGRIIELRRSLRGELARLRAAIAAEFGASQRPSPEGADLEDAVAEYSEGFERWFAVTARDDENAERTMRAFVSLTGAALPANSAVLCAQAAVQSTARSAARPGTAFDRRESASDRMYSPDLRVLIIRPMNVRPCTGA